jgi:hypothetical protein
MLSRSGWSQSRLTGSNRGRNRALPAAIDPLDVLFDVEQGALVKWVIWFILACLGGIAIVLELAWGLGRFGGLARSLDVGIAAVLGILVSSALGAGLMALMFYSNRSGIDERAWREQRGRTRKDHRH